MELIKFAAWPEVMAHAKAGRPLYYQAPMDHRATRFLPGSKQTFTYAAQGRTVRLWPPGSVGRGKNRTADPFNADSKHLERFSRPAEQKVESSGMAREGRRVASHRNPSLPGFPDMPDTLEIRIPKMPMWEQIGGDMDPGAHGGILAKSDGDALEMLEIQPVRNAVGDKEAADVGFPFWTRTAYYDLSDLDPTKKEVQDALRSSGFDEGDQKHWLEEKATPEQRALAIAEALLSYGVGVDEGDSGWSDDVIHEDVKWWGDKVAGSEYIADEDEEFKNDVLGYSEIREKLEEMVEQMAEGSAAQTYSTLGDRETERAERQGYDPESLVGVAEFGDSVGVNGDLETEKTLVGVETDLEKDGYEMLDVGGSIPTTEEHVSPEHAIRAVAREMDIEEDVVKEAAQGIDWWPKSRHDEIASSVSGYAEVWGKKDKHAHVEDGDYVIQGSWSDGRVSDSFGMNDEESAVSAAKKLLRDPTFEGDEVTVITRDGELVWSSNPDEGNHTEERRKPRANARRRH